jgi:hypothetical protein
MCAKRPAPSQAMCVETCALLRAGAFIIARRYKYGRAIFDTWMRRQLIDIGETVVNNAFGAPRIWQVGRPATVVCATVGVRDARRNGRVTAEAAE